MLHNSQRILITIECREGTGKAVCEACYHLLTFFLLLYKSLAQQCLRLLQGFYPKLQLFFSCGFFIRDLSCHFLNIHALPQVTLQLFILLRKITDCGFKMVILPFEMFNLRFQIIKSHGHSP
ncbi:hypothetical protein D3C85_1378990 [compost metagenome]